MRKKLVELLKIVKRELSLAERKYNDAKKSAEEIAKTSAGSPSQAGDRFHSQGSADLARGRLDAIRDLKDEIKTSLKKPIPNYVEPPCFVKLGTDEFYLVDNIVHLPGVKLVSAKSPFGQDLMGKEAQEIG